MERRLKPNNKGTRSDATTEGRWEKKGGERQRKTRGKQRGIYRSMAKKEKKARRCIRNAGRRLFANSPPSSCTFFLGQNGQILINTHVAFGTILHKYFVVAPCHHARHNAVQSIGVAPPDRGGTPTIHP